MFRKLMISSRGFIPRENENIITENAALRPHSSHTALLEFEAEAQLAKNRGHSLMCIVSLVPFRILNDRQITMLLLSILPPLRDSRS